MKSRIEITGIHTASAAALLLLAGLSACVATAPVAVPSSEFPKIEPVSSTVPKECAAFIGGWAGTWTNGDFGQLRLWITNITDSCEASYTYNGRDGVGKISSGTLPVPCGGGTCYFSQSGDSLSASYSQSSSQRANFGRIIPAK